MSMETEMIRVQLPDGTVREVPHGTTPLEIATAISPRLAAAVVVAKVKPLAGLDINQSEGGTDDAPADSAEAMYDPAIDPSAEKIVDLSTPLEEDVELWLLKEQDEAALKVVRHSAAHVMATAILELFPETKLGHGPATDQGFFYDVYRETPFTEARSCRHRNAAWQRSSRATSPSCVRSSPASKGSLPIMQAKASS